MKRYCAHGLTFASEIDLVEFLPGDGDSDADAVIEIAPLETPPDLPQENEQPQVMVRELRPRAHWLFVPGVAEYLVQDGRSIRVSPEAGAEESTVRLWLLGSAMGLVLHQRGLLVLHGAGVLVGGRVAVFLGDSGAGKSTLAGSFARAGHPVLGDDTLAVHRGPEGPVVWPGSRVMKLWSESARALGVSLEGCERVGARFDKFWVGVGQVAPYRAYPLAQVVELARADGAVRIEPLGLLDATRLIATHTYRPEFVRMMSRDEDHFRQCADLAAGITALRFERPWDTGRIAEGIDALGELLPGMGRRGGPGQE